MRCKFDEKTDATFLTLNSSNEWLSLFPVSQMVTVPTETLGIDIPSSLMGVILTAVPGSVVLQLIDPNARASVANEFQEGRTPGWYTVSNSQESRR